MAAAPAGVHMKGSFKLLLEPADKITFEGPFTGDEKKLELKLTNPADDGKTRAFKVKCTSNALFRIRPAVAKLGPGQSAATAIVFIPDPNKKDSVPADNEHLISVYHIQMEKVDETPRKVWIEHSGEAEGSVRMPVVFVKKEPPAPPAPASAPAAPEPAAVEPPAAPQEGEQQKQTPETAPAESKPEGQ